MSVIFINPYRFGATYDADAAAFIATVEAADGQALEAAWKDAINAFVVGCKSDPSPNPGVSNWQAIKACCIPAGARTLAGALVPLVGPAPTNIGLSDYNRKTGLIGTAASSNRLISNYTIPSANQDNAHGAAWVSSQMVPFNRIIFGNADGSHFGMYPATVNTAIIACNSGNFSNNVNITGIGGSTGFWGISRNSSITINYKIAANTGSVSRVSATPRSAVVNLFAGDPVLGESYPSNARLAFYSIGEAVDLPLLDARVTALINALAAAIP